MNTPFGDAIGFGRPNDDATGGYLDTDEIPPFGSTGRWVENIVFPADRPAPNGAYKFWVDMYSGSLPASSWVVEVYLNEVRQIGYSGTEDSHDCSTFSCDTGFIYNLGGTEPFGEDDNTIRDANGSEAGEAKGSRTYQEDQSSVKKDYLTTKHFWS